MLHRLACLVVLACLGVPPVAAATLDLTVTASEPVIVTGTPRLAIDVGGITRYAIYTSGSNSPQLSFSYEVAPGDFDPDGVDVSPVIDLNGGTITDAAGNPVSPLTFTAPDTSNLRVQTYLPSFTSTSNPGAISFIVDKAPVNAAFTYEITSSNGLGSVTGSGTFGSLSHTVSGIDVSGLAAGTLALSVTASLGGASGLPRNAAVTPTPGFTGPLDGVASVASAYSVRRLREGYTGQLLRVRRSSDSAVRDIAATFAGNLDTATLTGFCGSDSCSVSTWYDQSGNGRNAVQPTAASQPRIVDAGVMKNVNQRPAITGDGVDDQMLFPLGPLVNYPASINIVLARTSASERGSWVKLGGLGPASSGIALGIGWPLYFYNFGQTIIGLKEAVTWMQSSATLASSAVVTYTQNAGASTTAMFQNGSALSGSNFSQAPLAPDGTTGYLFGHLYAFGSGEQRWSLNPISEIVLTSSVLSTATRQALESNQGAYYGLPGF